MASLHTDTGGDLRGALFPARREICRISSLALATACRRGSSAVPRVLFTPPYPDGETENPTMVASQVASGS
jgi:hypothetical protein